MTTASATAAGTLAASAVEAAAQQPPAHQAAASRELYELRVFQLRRGPMQKRADDFFQAAIPALNRAGIGPVGVFHVLAGPDSPAVYFLMPHKSLDSFLTMPQRLQGDAEFQKAGADFLDASPTDPAFVGYESSLMLAFEGMPRLEVPAGAAGKKPRIFELRTYQSHSQKAHVKKVEMFNRGEIAIFRRTGLAPVFFGSTLVGSKLPNLTYMLVFDSMAQREKNWATFVADPEWKTLSTTPGYTDPEIVSNISSMFLRPAPYSQI